VPRAWEWNGMGLHEMYFANLTKERANLEKAAGLGAQISRDFGSREAWDLAWGWHGRCKRPISEDEMNRNIFASALSVLLLGGAAATVDPSVAVGTKVKIVESKDANGIKTLTVNPAS
jgi:hypothetical protein